MNVFSYEIGGKLYINLTNKCTNFCVFCVRNKPTYDGYSLWLDSEPTAKEVLDSIDDLSKYSEVVFCGYGEPTYKIDELKTLAKEFKKQGKKTRLNTNGHGNRINGRNIAKELVGLIDVVSISLNASNGEAYQKLCNSVYGEKAFDELKDFAKKCVNEGLDTYLSIVDSQGVDEIACREIANSCGAKLKVREYIEV